MNLSFYGDYTFLVFEDFCSIYPINQTTKLMLLTELWFYCSRGNYSELDKGSIDFND